MTKKQTVELLQQQLPGFYSVEQVINLINGIEESSSFDVDQLEDIIMKISDRVETSLNRMSSDDFVDLGSAEFELNGNEISLYAVETNTSSIIDEVEEAVRETLTDFFPAPSETES